MDEAKTKAPPQTLRQSPRPPAFRRGAGIGRAGGYGEEDTPDPIPNSDVKPLCADGTAS